MKTTGLISYVLQYGELRGTRKGEAWKWVCFGDLGRHTMFGLCYACFMTWS